MYKNEYSLTVDIKRSFKAIIPTFVQYDSAKLRFYILDDNTPFDLAGFTSAKVYHRRPDKTVIDGNATLEIDDTGQQYIEYKYLGSEMSKIGTIETSLSLFSDDKKISVRPFSVKIVKDLSEYYTEPSNPEYGELQRLIAEVKALVNKAENAVENAAIAIEDVTVLKDDIVTLRDDITILRDETVAVRDGAMSATVDAIQATGSAELATERANTASQNAEDAAQEALEKSDFADEATLNANTKATYAQEQGDYAKQQGDVIKDELETLELLKDDIEASVQGAENTKNETELVRQNTELERLATEQIRLRTEQEREKTELARLATEEERLVTEAIRLETVAAKEGAIEATQDATEAVDKANSLINSSTHKGLYSNTAEYAKNNEVRFNGSSYVALQNTIGNTPPTSQESNEYWELRAQRGVDGTGSVSSVNDIYPDVDGNVDLGDLATDWSSIEGKPEVLNKLSESDGQLEYNGLPVGPVLSVNGKTGAVTLNKGDIGLDSVDNIKQASKTEFDEHADDTGIHVTVQDKNEWNTKETPENAQLKADEAEQNAKNYADQKVNSIEKMKILRELFTSTSNQTVFNLNIGEYTPGENRISVTIEGVPQYSPQNFIEVSSTSIALTEPVTDAEVVIEYFASVGSLTEPSGLTPEQESKLNSIEHGAEKNLITSVNGQVGDVVVEGSGSASELGVNIKDFGAIGDGVSDDTGAILSALTYARDSSTGIVIPDGVYNVSSTITLQKYDHVNGQSAEKTILRAITPNMTVFDFTGQESTVKNLHFTASADTRYTYTAIELNCTNYVIDNIEIMQANTGFYVPNRGVYINNISNVFMYLVHYGLYCEDGIDFNGNRINIRTMHGSNYDSGTYIDGDIGIRLVGYTNEITGGELAGFEYGVEVVEGGNNQFGSIYMEYNKYGFKNTAREYQDISKAHVGVIHQEGSEALMSENGLGTVGLTRPMGVRGFDPLGDALMYFMFDELENGNEVVDQTGNGNNLILDDMVNISDFEGGFGVTKKVTFPLGPASTNYWEAIDTTEPLSIVWSSRPIVHDEEDYDIKTFVLSGSNGAYIRAIELSRGGFSIEINNSVDGRQFLYSSSSGGIDGVSTVVIDFENDKIIRVDLPSALFHPVSVDLSDFKNMKADLRLLQKNDTSSYSETETEYVYNYLMVYPKALSYHDIIEIVKMKRHVPTMNNVPNSYLKVLALKESVVPKGGGSYEGVVKAHNNIEYSTAQIRNVILSPLDADVSKMSNGDIWIKHE